MGSALHVVFVTAPDPGVGRNLARVILEGRLAACVNIVPAIESHYWWQGKIDKSSEVLLLIKTTTVKLKALEKLVRQNHPYETPEFVAIPASLVSKNYLAWVRDSIKPA